MIHDKYDGRKVRIPQPKSGWVNPFAGKIGDVKYAGWDDWYYVFVDGKYLVKAQAHEIARDLLSEREGENDTTIKEKGL
jgi:hypothetical protein